MVRVTYVPKLEWLKLKSQSHRPFSLMSFLSKTVVDGYICRNMQYGYQTGKFIELVFHKPVAKISKSIESKEIAVHAFLAIRGVFINIILYRALSRAKLDRGLEPIVVKWSSMFDTRSVTSLLQGMPAGKSPFPPAMITPSGRPDSGLGAIWS
ncbi:hypothetical protein Trydic_g15313 [Trypoxylus dichotomus]